MATQILYPYVAKVHMPSAQDVFMAQYDTVLVNDFDMFMQSVFSSHLYL